METPSVQTSVTLNHPSIGRSPAGFPRVHVELPPSAVGRLVGYDPRVLIMKPPTRRVGKGTRVAPIPHNVAPKIIELQNKVQRSIDKDRVASMVQYLYTALTTDAFADWGAIEIVTSTQPNTDNLEARHEISFDSNADYFIADGQHRYCAILDFVQRYPEFARQFTQAVTISILPGGKLEEWAGQAFHDRNYFAVGVRAGKALAVDSRDPVNALAKSLDTNPTISRAGGIAYERDTLLQGDTRFTTHSVLHRFVKGFLLGRPGLDRGNDERIEVGPSQENALADYIRALGEVLPWVGETREDFLTRSSVVFSALAVIGHDLWSQPDVMVRAGAIAALAKMDWRRTNLEWVGVLGSEKDGRVIPSSSRPAIDGTIRYLRRELGLLPQPS